MLIPQRKERRASRRRRLSGLLPGRIRLQGQESSLSCRPVDVSERGMGILVDQEIEEGANLVLSLSDRDVRFRVEWVQPDYGKKSMFRYGLVVLDPDENIEEIFIRAGCLR